MSGYDPMELGATEKAQDAMLVPVEPSALAIDFFTGPAGPDAIIEAVREKVSGFAADATTATGRAAIKSFAYKVTRTKTAIDDIGKALVAEYKAIPAQIDATRKRLRDELDAIKDEVRRPLTEWENAEKDRVEELKARVASFKAMAEVALGTSAEAMAWIEHVQGVEIDDTYQEMKGVAAIAKDAALARLRERHAAAINAEKVEAERRERERQEAVKEAEREAQEKVAREKLELENQALRAKAAQEKAERDAAQARADAERKAQEAVEAERRRVEAEAEKALQEEAKRVADAAHRFEVHREILNDITQVAGLSYELSMVLLDAIRDGRVRNVKIDY